MLKLEKCTERSSNHMIALGIQEGNRAYEELLIKKYQQGLNAVLSSMSIEAELSKDVMQETWIVVINNLRNGRVRNLDALGAFIRSVGRNQAIMALRKIRVFTSFDEQDYGHHYHSSNSSVEDSYEQKQKQAALADAIDNLTQKRDRELLRGLLFKQKSKAEQLVEFDLSSVHYDRVLHRAKLRTLDAIAC